MERVKVSTAESYTQRMGGEDHDQRVNIGKEAVNAHFEVLYRDLKSGCGIPQYESKALLPRQPGRKLETRWRQPW
jgi:hypothetical protein